MLMFFFNNYIYFTLPTHLHSGVLYAHYIKDTLLSF